MVEKEYEYIRGNTAVQPKRKEYEVPRRKSLEEVQRERKEKAQKLKNKQKGTNRAIVQGLIVLGVVGIWTIARDARIYKMQSELEQIKTDTKVIMDNNEALRVDLLKFSSIETIKTKAKELGMEIPNSDSTINVNLQKDYFPKIAGEN